jgi:hypothetical protein
LAKNRNPLGVTKKTKRKTDKDVQQMKKGRAKQIGNILKYNAYLKRNMKKGSAKQIGNILKYNAYLKRNMKKGKKP